MATNKRQKILVNSRVQRAMILHTALHWTLFLAGTLVLLFCLQILLGEPSGSYAEHVERMWARYAPAFVVLLALMPVVVYDTMKLGHRIAGPMFRLRGALHRLANGERVEPVHFRKQDFWQEMAADFNTVLGRFQNDADKAAGRACPDDDAADNSWQCVGDAHEVAVS